MFRTNASVKVSSPDGKFRFRGIVTEVGARYCRVRVTDIGSTNHREGDYVKVATSWVKAA